MADDANMQIAAGIDNGVEAGKKKIADEVGKGTSTAVKELTDKANVKADEISQQIAASGQKAKDAVNDYIDDTLDFTPKADDGLGAAVVKKLGRWTADTAPVKNAVDSARQKAA